MLSTQIVEVAKKLSQFSVKGYYSPYDSLIFPEKIEMNSWHSSPELSSLYGTDYFEKLSEDQKKKLSFYEAVNFYSLNIHGEKSLIEGLAHRLYAFPEPEISQYIHHFLDEENKHMIYFGTYCHKYAKKVYPDKRFSFPRDYAEGEEDFLFFGRVFIFEEIVDFYNRFQGKDSRLELTSKKINENHHIDESRHLAFGRLLMKELWDKYSPTWSEEIKEGTRTHLLGFLESTWRDYYNPEMYKDAGLVDLEDPYELSEKAFHHPSQTARREEINRLILNTLKKVGV